MTCSFFPSLNEVCGCFQSHTIQSHLLLWKNKTKISWRWFFFCFLFFFPFVVERQSWLHQLVNHLVGRGWERKDIDGSRKKTNKTNNNSCVQRFENEGAKGSTLADVGSLCFLFSSSKLLWFMTYYAHLFLFDIFQSFLLRLLFVGHEARHPNDTIFVIWISSSSFV